MDRYKWMWFFLMMLVISLVAQQYYFVRRRMYISGGNLPRGQNTCLCNTKSSVSEETLTINATCELDFKCGTSE